jgi:hypothetical protein
LLSVPLSSDQSADFCNCLIDLIEQSPALFELRRQFCGDANGVVCSPENHAPNDRRATNWGAVLLYQIHNRIFLCSNHEVKDVIARQILRFQHHLCPTPSAPRS